MSNLSIQFQVECKDTKPGEEVYLVGNTNELGNWKSENSQKLKTSSNKFPLWESSPISFQSKSQLEYKYIIIGKSHHVKWESFDGNRTIDLSSLGNDFYIVNDGRFSNKSNQQINKSDGAPVLVPSRSKSNKKKRNISKKKSKANNNSNNKNTNHNSNNYQYVNTNADEYVKSRREDIKNVDIKQLNYRGSANNVNKSIEQFVDLLVQKNNEKKTWREKLATTCQLINDNYNNDQIISLIAAYLYFVNSGQIKCSEDGTHFRPNHSAQHAFNIFKRLYKQIFENSEQINENSFSVVARSILRNLPSFNDQFMVSVPLTRIRDIAHRSDIPHDLKQEIKHKLQNKLHRNASPDDLVVCEYFINKIKHANYSEAFKKEFYIFYDELKEFFNSNNLENLLHKFKGISGQNASQTQEVIDSLKNSDLAKRIEIITNFRENVCSKIIKKEVESGDQIQKTLLQTTSNLDIELENKLFVIISEYIDKLTRNNSNKFENNYFKNLLNLFKLCLRNIEISEIAKKQATNLKLDLEHFHKGVDKLNKFVMLQIKSLIERGNNISIEICSHLEHLFDLENLVYLGNKLNINQRAVLIFVESFIRSNIIFQFSKCCDLLMTITRDYLNLPPYNIINKGSVQGEFYYFENIDAYNQQNISEDSKKILLIENSDGTEEVPKNVIGIMLNQDLSQLSHISIRVRQHKAAFCCVLDPKIFKNYISKFKNRDLVSFECLNESQITLNKIDKITQNDKKKEKEKEKDVNQNNNNNNKENNNKDGKKKKKIIKKVKKQKDKEKEVNEAKEPKEPKEELIYSVKDKEVFKTGSKFEKIKTLYDISAKSGLFTTPFALCIPSNVYEYFFNLFLTENQGNFALLENTEIKNLDTQSENFRNIFVNFIMHLYDEKEPKIMEILDTISSQFSSLSTNNNLLAIRSSSNLEDNSGQAGAGLFDSYLNIDLNNKSEVIKHIAKVWASVFNSRAIINRRNSNIDTKVARMSVIIMQMTEPDFCYVIHTINPINGNKNEVYIELAIGLGETLAQSNQKGAPYRIIYNRKDDTLNILNLSSYCYEMERKTSNIKMIEYRNEDLTKSEDFINVVGKRLGKIGIMIEENISKEKVGQDIEGNYMKDGGDKGNYYIVQTRPEIA
jgi:phosphoglucan,water dikinase